MIALNGRPCSSISLLVPWSGRWVVRVTLPGDAPAGRVSITWGSATLLGAVEPGSAGSWQGEARATVVGGLGWATVLPPAWIQNEAGLVAASLAQQVAALAKETLVAPANAFRVLRTAYPRPRRSASGTLRDLLAPKSGWWVDLDGTTRAGVRPAPPAPQRVEILDLDPRQRVAALDADDVGQALVGSIISAAPPRRPSRFRIVELLAEAGSAGQRFTAFLEAA